MRGGVRRVAFVVAVVAAAACSLTTDLTGLSESGSEETPDGAGVDTAVVDVVIADVATDVPAPPCKASTVIDTPLTTDLGSWSKFGVKRGEYPKVETFFGTSAAVLLPFVDTTPILLDAGDPDAAAEAGPSYYNPPELADAISAIWQTTPVALRSFDVELELYVRCTKAGSCADGVAFAWLGTTSVSALTNTNLGGAQGIPSSVDGVAVLLDDYTNKAPEIPDPTAPSLQVVQLDKTKVPGKYPWILTSKSTPFLGAWHKIGVSLRGTAVTVRYDGAVALSTTVTPLVTGLVGISGGTGGESDAVAVRNFKGSFYDCVP